MAWSRWNLRETWLRKHWQSVDSIEKQWWKSGSRKGIGFVPGRRQLWQENLFKSCPLRCSWFWASLPKNRVTQEAGGGGQHCTINTGYPDDCNISNAILGNLPCKIEEELLGVVSCGRNIADQEPTEDPTAWDPTKDPTEDPTRNPTKIRQKITEN